MKKLVLIALVSFSSCYATLVATHAQAESPGPQLGGCFASGAVCVNPAILVPAVIRLDVKASTFELVPALGGCYGIAYRQDMWWSPGLDLCLSVRLSNQTPNQVTPALLFKFMGVRAGADLRLTQVSGQPLDKDVGVLFTYGWDVGGSPAYVAKAAQKGGE